MASFLLVAKKNKPYATHAGAIHSSTWNPSAKECRNSMATYKVVNKKSWLTPCQSEWRTCRKTYSLWCGKDGTDQTITRSHMWSPMSGSLFHKAEGGLWEWERNTRLKDVQRDGLDVGGNYEGRWGTRQEHYQGLTKVQMCGLWARIGLRGWLTEALPRIPPIKSLGMGAGHGANDTARDNRKIFNAERLSHCGGSSRAAGRGKTIKRLFPWSLDWNAIRMGLR